MLKRWIQVVCFITFCQLGGTSNSTKPHIIFIIADDLGWNDVSFHGSNQIPTPNIDALAYNGVILNNHYCQAFCTPSRAALLTGKYPIRTGMQHLVLLEAEPRGLPLNETLLPQHLKKAGYVTHAIGKWHLGFFQKKYTPTYRGFDTHFGYWNGYQDYYDHYVQPLHSDMDGYDMRRGMSVDYAAKGRYSTELFTEEATRLIREHDASKPMFMYFAHLAPHTGNPRDPMQAPEEEVAKFAHISDPNRRKYAAMVSMMDKSVGKVITALYEKGMMANTIVVFISDNGGQSIGKVHPNYASNYPLRGLKSSPWEGGTRTAAAIWSPLLNHTQRVSTQMMHITDWMPTLLSAAGIDPKTVGKIDGQNVWESISSDAASPRDEFLYNIDINYSAIRQGDWKFINGTYDNTTNMWYGDSGLDQEYQYSEEDVLRSDAFKAISKFWEDQEEPKGKKVELSMNKAVTKEKITQLKKDANINCHKKIDETKACNPWKSRCLFNLRTDPCETTDLSRDYPSKVMNLIQAMAKYYNNYTPPANKPIDMRADPKNFGGIWTTWWDELQLDTSVNSEEWNKLSTMKIIFISIMCLLYSIVLVTLVTVSVKSEKRKKKKDVGSAEEMTTLKSPNEMNVKNAE